jgi:hypothetical protein
MFSLPSRLLETTPAAVREKSKTARAEKRPRLGENFTRATRMLGMTAP